MWKAPSSPQLHYALECIHKFEVQPDLNIERNHWEAIFFRIEGIMKSQQYICNRRKRILIDLMAGSHVNPQDILGRGLFGI